MLTVVEFFTVILVVNSPVSSGRQAQRIRKRPAQSLMLLLPAQPRSSDESGTAVDCPDGVVKGAPVTETAALPWAKRHTDARVPAEPATLNCTAPSKL